MSLEEYYYRLEAALASRSVVDESYEDLEEFGLKEELDKTSSGDPYIGALCDKYGIYCKKNIEMHHTLLTAIEENIATCSKWISSGIDMKKFVYYQLSDYYLRHEQNAKLQKKYFELAVSHGHRVAIQEQAELMSSIGGDDQTHSVIALCVKAARLGNTDCYRLLIESYTKIKDYAKAMETYGNLIDTERDDINPVKDFHTFVNTHCDDEKYIRKYVEILIKSPNKFTINFILLYKAFIDDNLILEILLDTDKEKNTVLLPKLLCLFNQEPELFTNFIELVCQKLKNIS